MDEFVEFENARTGRTRKFPRVLYEELIQLCLRCFPAESRERVEAQVGSLVASFLDEQAGATIQAAAVALFPEMEGIRFNTYQPEVLAVKLKTWADQVFARYGAPVYLVGSALQGEGRDVDIRVMLPDPDFNARFPTPEALALEVGKQGRHAALFSRTNVDFQIQRVSDAWVYQDKPKLRLDSAAYPEAYEPPKAGIGGE